MVTVAHVVTRCTAGAGGVVVRGATSLPAGYRSVVVTGECDPSLEARAVAHGVEVVLVPDLVSPVRPTQDYRAAVELTRLLGRLGPDVVHTHSAKAGVLGRRAAAAVGTPRVVHTMHGHPWHPFQSRARRATYLAIERHLAPMTDLYLAVGTAIATDLLVRGIATPGQVRTIGPAVDPAPVVCSPASRAEARRRMGVEPAATVVGTVGRLDAQKAPEVLIEALAAMRHTSAVGVWVGDGPLRQRMEHLAGRYGLADRMRFLGHREDAARLLPGFDVFALSSRYEGLPCAVVEAQQCGVPVVATAVDGVLDVVSPGETGLLVPPEAPAALAMALDHVLDHPVDAARWVSAARAQLRDRYSPETLADVLLEAYSPADVAGSTRSHLHV